MRLIKDFAYRSLLFTLTASACILLASGCAGSAPTPAVSITAPVIKTPTFPVTSTPVFTSTPWPSATLPATETPLPTIAFTITPDSALAEVKLLGGGWRKGYDYFFSFQFNQPVDAKNYRLMVEEKEYACQVLSEFPNRLYCIGPGAKVLSTAEVRLFQVESEVPAFEKDVWIPYFSE